MGTHYAIKLIPKTPFHLGGLMDMERTEDVLHSDTLFSALCNVSDNYMGKENYREFINPFLEGKPSFLMSSAFPFFETPEKTICFFPKPLNFKKFVDKHPKNVKVFKKIKFVSFDIFNAYLTRNDDFLENQFQEGNGNLKADRFLQNNLIWLSEEERKLMPAVDNLWKIQREPRIVVDRITRETSIYHYSRLHFQKNSGLFVLLKMKEGDVEKKLLGEILKKFRYLGDTGIGGERTLGNGQFELKLSSANEPYEIELSEEKTDSKSFVSLSLLLPTKVEVKDRLMSDNSYYQIINRKGWITGTTYLRKSVNMLLEGSVLNKNGSQFYGKIEDLTPQILLTTKPDYKIHRYGYGYPVNIHI